MSMRASTSLTNLQKAAVDGFLQQMAMMGVAPDDPEETPRNIVYVALCAGYGMVVAGAMGDYVAAKLKQEGVQKSTTKPRMDVL